MTSDTRCFCELAPLYALGLLSVEDSLWVEQQLQDCPELAAELADYQQAMTAIAYGVTPTSPAPALKQRLWDRLALDPQTLDPQPPTPPTLNPQPPAADQDWPAPLTALRAQDWTWQPHRTPGVEVAILHTNAERREVVGVLRANPGVRYPSHRHASVEEIYMLSGELIVDGAVYGAGDYLRSEANSVHMPIVTPGGCMFFFRTSMDDDYFE